jgi:HAE1 family hydrophobic/amphiphilic exporter-1
VRIADFSIKHPAVISIVAAAVIVFGIVALRTLSQELIPDTSLPTLVVVTEYPGVGPEEIEEQVTKILEDTLATTSELSKITSASVSSSSSITMEFLWETDIDAKLPEVREKISDVLDDLPDGISGPPTIIKVSSGLIPIFTFTISGEVDPYELAEFARDVLVPELAQIPGAATVNLKGAVDRELAVRVEPARLAARDLDVLSVLQVLSAYGKPIPAGTSEYRGDLMSLRTSGSYSSERELEMVVVGSQDSIPILLRDVATVRVRETDPTFTVLRNGEPTVAIDMTKRRGADSLQIIAEARSSAERCSSPKSETRGAISTWQSSMFATRRFSAACLR